MCLHFKLTFLGSSWKLLKAKKFLIVIIKSDKLEHLKKSFVLHLLEGVGEIYVSGVKNLF